MKKSIFMITYIFLMIMLLSATLRAQQIVKEVVEGDEKSEIGSGIIREIRGDVEEEEVDLCMYGQMQSPVDLSYVSVEFLRPQEAVITRYQPSTASLRNRGHDIAVEWRGDAGSIKINGTAYQLLQVHWHVPSEHTINGIRYPLERHAVHVNADTNETAVIGVLYAYGLPDPFLSQLMENLTYMVETGVNQTEPGVIDPNENILGHDNSFYRYIGSLTTPPCTEGIIWTVQNKIRTVSTQQVALLLDAVHGNENSRELQARNGRKIYLYISWTQWTTSVFSTIISSIQNKLLPFYGF